MPRRLTTAGSHARRHIAAVLVALAWSSAAFCGEIHDVVKGGDIDKAKALLKSNPALVASKNKDGWTPLHVAVIDGNKNMVQLLLSISKAEVNARNNRNVTPLEDMAERTDMVLSFGSSYGTTGTASEKAESANDPMLAIAALLIANGANTNGDAKFVQTAPLLQACRAKNWSFASMLIQSGARPDIAFPDGPDKGMTPLHYAVGYGNAAVVKLLIAHKAPINAVAEKYSTPLHVAVMMGQPAIATLLRQQGGHE
jgi:ankyrin repeat protein